MAKYVISQISIKSVSLAHSVTATRAPRAQTHQLSTMADPTEEHEDYGEVRDSSSSGFPSSLRARLHLSHAMRNKTLTPLLTCQPTHPLLLHPIGLRGGYR